MSADPLPFAGTVVLEFGHTIMGPSCGLLLADLGAEVIKIEPAPEGESTRRLPGFGAGFFSYYNRNKRSLAVDAKTPEGREILLRLVDRADVAIENFGPGTMDRLGLGSTELRERNPRLVFCELKGFLSGPDADRPALDEVVQMMGGLAYMTGPPGRPLRAGASVVDLMGGMFGALAILAALHERERTGRGQHVRSALFESVAFMMGQHMAFSAIAGVRVPPMPARVAAWAIYDVFTCADDVQLFVGITGDKQWTAFCERFGAADLANDPRLATNAARSSERPWLLDRIAAIVAQHSAAEIAAACEAAGVSYAPIGRPEDLFTNEHLLAGGHLAPTRLTNGATAMLPLLPIELGGRHLPLRTQPPGPGADTDTILASLGYDTDAVTALAARGIVSRTGSTA